MAIESTLLENLPTLLTGPTALRIGGNTPTFFHQKSSGKFKLFLLVYNIVFRGVIHFFEDIQVAKVKKVALNSARNPAPNCFSYRHRLLSALNPEKQPFFSDNLRSGCTFSDYKTEMPDFMIKGPGVQEKTHPWGTQTGFPLTIFIAFPAKLDA